MFKNEKLNRIIDITGIFILFGLFSILYFPESSDGKIMTIFYMVVELVFVSSIIYKVYKFKHYKTTHEK